jgi:hypothetical protein
MLIQVCDAKYQSVIEAAIKRAIRDLPKTPEFGLDDWRTGDLLIVVAEVPADVSAETALRAIQIAEVAPV